MKINRLLALGAIALLVVATMGAISMKVFAQSSSRAGFAQDCPQGQEQENEGTDVESADQAETADCGDQNGADAQESEGSADTGSDGSAHEQETAPAGTPAITAEAAQKTAEEYLKAGTAVRVELDTDDQSGALIYSVEFSNGTDVSVDAMTGKVLGTEPSED